MSELQNPDGTPDVRVFDKNTDPIQWAVQGVLAYGGRPGYPRLDVPASVVDSWLTRVRQQGVRSVIVMLSDEYEMNVYYRHLDQPLIEYYSGAGLSVRCVSHMDRDVPVSDAILLARVRYAFEALPQPVLIQCSAGLERSRDAALALSRIRG